MADGESTPEERCTQLWCSWACYALLAHRSAAPPLSAHAIQQARACLRHGCALHGAVGVLHNLDRAHLNCGAGRSWNHVQAGGVATMAWCVEGSLLVVCCSPCATRQPHPCPVHRQPHWQPSGFRELIAARPSLAARPLSTLGQGCRQHANPARSTHSKCAPPVLGVWPFEQVRAGLPTKMKVETPQHSDRAPPVFWVWPLRKSGSASFRSISNSSSTCTAVDWKTVNWLGTESIN